MKKYIPIELLILVFFFVANKNFAQDFNVHNVIYKTIDTLKLSMDIYTPEKIKKGVKTPAIIFYFGGGWNSGTRTQFEPHAKHFATRGMIAVLVDYRVKTRNNTTPYQAAADALSAIRFLRTNASKYGIDPDRIAASGGSAGGHLAAVTGNITGLDETYEDQKISSKANALILFNPVFDNGPTGYGFDRVGGESGYKKISPIDNIRKGAPPTSVLLGTKDHLIPVSTAQRYQKLMQEAGSRCDLHLFENQKHGFFNYKKDNENSKFPDEALRIADAFLVSLGYLNP